MDNELLITPYKDVTVVNFQNVSVLDSANIESLGRSLLDLVEKQDTRKLILERGLAVWLEADVDTILDRVRRKNTRPLLRSGDPREIVSRLSAERAPLYAEAPIHVPSGGGPHGDTVARIVEELDRWR